MSDTPKTRQAILFPVDWNQPVESQRVSTYDEAAWQEVLREAKGAGAEVITLKLETKSGNRGKGPITIGRWVEPRWEPVQHG